MTFAQMMINSSGYFKNSLKLLVLFLVFFCANHTNVYATHALGSTIQVEYVASNQYKVKLSIYRDCNGINLPISQNISWSGSCGVGSSAATRVAEADVTTICASQASACDGGGGVFGIEKHDYETTITFPPGCTDVNINWDLCCRNRAITTLNDPNTDRMYNEVFLKDPGLINNSPEFIFDPIQFLPIANSAILNYQCTDQDGDSLVYRIVNAKGQNGVDLTYLGGYSGAVPLGPGMPVSLDPKDGLLTISQTNATEVGVMAIEVDEYRNGVKIGSIRQDMNLRILNQVLQTTRISPLIGNGGLLSADTVLLVEQPFHAEVYVTRVNIPSETAVMTAQVIDSISGASYTTTVIGFDSVLVSMDWTPTLADIGSQYFSIRGTSLNCPLTYETNQSFRVLVDSLPPPIPNPITVNANCGNSLDGKAFHNASNLITGYTLQWLDASNNIISTSDTLNNQNPGTYYLAIRNGPAYGVVRDTVVIGNDQFGGLLSAFILNPPIGCATPHAVFFTDQSIVPDTWLWNFGDGNTSTLQNPFHSYTTTGTFPVSLTVVDTITGCNSVSTDVVKVSVTTADFTGAALFGCGPLTVNFNDNSTSSGSSIVNWSWSFGDGGVSSLQDPSYTYDKPGIYTVSLTVIDGNGCSNIKTRTNYVQVIGPDVNFGADTTGGPIPLTINFSDSTIFGAPIVNWTWNFGDGASSNLQNPTHIYTTPDTVDVSLTVLDIDGCSRTFTRNNYITVGLLSSMQITDSISCNTANDGEITANAIGGTPPYTYAWSSGETTQTIVGKSPTNYTVTITDSGGVMANSTITLTEPSSISANITGQNNALCFGMNNGTATANGANGKAPYSYAWSNGQTTATASGLVAGTYTVSVSDANNCQPGIAMVTITEPTALSGDSTVISVDCHHAATGSATANVTGGTGTYTYSWISGETTQSITNKAADAYPVTIYDSDGCGPLVIPVIIDEPDHFHMRIDSSVSSQISCFGLDDGVAVAHGHGGVKPFTFAWSHGPTTDTVKNLPPGTYTASITDANGCGPISKSYMISQPDTLIATASLDSAVTCNGFSNGGATASATGGTLPYTYQWNNAATTASITGVLAGTYTVTITDQNNCSDISSVIITEPTILNSTTQLDSNVSCNLGSDGGATIIPSGGTAPYTYLWSNAATTAAITGLIAGTYSVTITDNKGCTSTNSILVSEPTAIVLSMRNDSNSTCLGIADGGATVLASNGTGVYTYAWSNSATTTSITGVANGTYTVTVTDANGCTNSNSIALTVVDTIKPSVITQNINLYLNTAGTASIATTDINNGSTDACGIATITLDSTKFDCSEVGANTVYLRVIDVNGNVDSTSAVVTVIDSIKPTVIAQNVSVYLDANGTTSITSTDINNGSTDACGIASITLDSTQFDCSEIGANTVQLKVTDVNGNVDSANAIVTIIDSIKPTVLTQNISIYLNAAGTASITTADINNGSSDNCSIASLNLDSTNFDCSEVGTNTVYLKVTDVNGNVDSASAVVTVIDTIKPTVVTQNVSVYLDANGSASITTANINNGSSDNCSIDNLSLDSTSFDCSEIGANTVYLKATDINGNINSASAIVTVIDTIKPTVIGQNISVYLTANGMASITAADLNNGNLDNCSIASFVIDSTQFDCSKIGANTVKLTVTDANGNVDSANAIVNVIDSIKPTVLTQNVSIYLNAAGTASITTADINNGSSDNCSIASLNLDSTNFDCSEVGTNTVYLKVTDVNGNVDSASAIVTVLDTIKPTVLTQNVSVYLNTSGLASITTADIDNGSSDNCGIVSLSLSKTASFDCSEIGANTVYLKATDINGNIDSASAIVTVIDTIKPTVIGQNISVYLTANGMASITAADLNNGNLDNCSIASFEIDSTQFDCSEIGANTVQLKVTDVNGNVDSANAIVTIIDSIKPTVLTQNISIYLNAAGTASITTADINNGSSDNCSIASLNLDSTNFDCSEVGTNTVQLIVTDVNGNIDSASAVVTVIDSIKPTVLAQNINLYLDVNGLASITTTDINNGSSDNCGIVSLSLSKTASFHCSEIGANTVYLKATDINGNIDSASAIVTVIDTIKPTVIGQNISVYLTANGMASITAADLNNGNLDNCSIASFEIDSTQFDCSEIGANTVQLKVTDVNGNVDSANAIVTIIDSIKPTVLTQNISIYLNAAGTASITTADINNGSSDNCSIASLNLDSTNFDCSEVGTNTVYLGVTDVNGNIDSASAVVTVIDSIKPTVLAQNINLYLDVNGLASITTTDINNGSSDNCGIVSLSLSKTAQFNCSEVGANTVYLRVTDVNGNVDSASAVVTVIDTIKPTVIGQNISVYLTANGMASITAADLNNGNLDNCSIASFVIDSTQFDCSEIGANTVQLKVTDVNGNIDSANAIVTVIDTIRPTVLTQNVSIYLNSTGTASITTANINNVSSDNCSIASLNLDSTNFDCSEVGTNTVYLKVTDVNRNVDSASAVVTVIDTIKPTVVTQNVSIYLDANGSASITTANINNGSSDNCSIATITLDSTLFNCSEVGANTVYLRVTDVNGNVDSVSAVVTVIDTIKPTVIGQNISVYLAANGMASITAADLNNGNLDNCSIASFEIDSTQFDCSEIGANTVQLKVTDVNGNVDSANAIVTVIDTIRPTVLTQNVSIYLNSTGTASITTANINNVSSDNCSIASLNLDSTNFDCSEVGTNTVYLRVTDVNGNVDSASAVVTVIDTIKPTVVTQNVSVYLDAAGLASITTADIDNGSSDNCSIATITLDSTLFNCSEVGANTVYLRVTDVNGNVDSVSAVVTVIDTIKPTVIGQNISVYLAANGMASITAADLNNGNLDNCSIASFVIDSTQFDCSEIGVNTVQLKVTDVNGNIDSANAIVTIIDSIRPTVLTQNVSIYLNSTGTASIATTDINNGSSDNCGIVSLSLSKTAQFNCSEVGANTVYLAVTDVNGNIDSASAIVTVIDSIKPVFTTCPSPISSFTDIGNCTAVISWNIPAASDNCTVDSIVGNYSSGTAFPIGQTEVIYIAYDQSLNTDTCRFTITVIDSEKPIFSSIPSTITQFNDAGKCSAIVNWTAPTPSDNCSIDSTRSNYQPGDEFLVGSTIVEYITYDANMNTDTARFIIVVRDTEVPQITCPASISTCDPVFYFTEPIGTDNCVNPLTVRTDTVPYFSGDSFPVGISTISYRVTDVAKNSVSCSFDVEVYEPAVANAGPDIATTDIEPVQIQGIANNASSVSWNKFMSLDDNTIANPVANPQRSTTYVMNVVSPDGCTDSDSIFIDVRVVQDLDANNLFTPNGDGKNETWEVNKVALIQDCRLVIFNRNGTQVFETRAYDNSWDGTVSGKQLPEGSYYYVIDCDDGRTYNGPITLLRLNK